MPQSDSPTMQTPDEADELIRSVMTEQRRVNSRDVFPDLGPADSADHIGEGAKHDRKKKRFTAKKPDPDAGLIARLTARVMGYRPTRKHLMIAALAIVVYFRPWLIPGLLFLTFWVSLIVFLTMGPDRFNERVWSFWEWLVRVRPGWAEKLRQTGSRFATKYNALRLRLPETWAEKLALPDLAKAAEERKSFEEGPDPFDRLRDLPEVYRG